MNRERKRQLDRESYHRNRFKREMKRFNLTKEDIMMTFARQDYACPICGEDLQILNIYTNKPIINFENYGKPFVFEHDHKTGKFRGFTCAKHNTLLANANDDRKILRAAERYLKRFEKTQDSLMAESGTHNPQTGRFDSSSCDIV